MPRIVVAYLREDRVTPYVDALAAAGLERASIALVTPKLAATLDLDALVDGADGLLLTGGADLEPRLYGEAPMPEAHLDPPVPERDRMDSELLAHARARRLPVFAICRGHQLVNVFLGGSLYQDVGLQAGLSGHGCYADNGFALDHLAHEALATAADHPFARRLGAIDAPLLVNSRHHQGVRRPGAAMVVAAEAPDGLIEATALDDADWWVRTVQWHPENLVADPPQLDLFADFLAAARRHAAARRVEVDR